MIRLALSWMALQMVGRIPNWPKADAVEVDMETGNTVLIWHDDGELKKINNARLAAASGFMFQSSAMAGALEWSPNSALQSFGSRAVT